MTLDGGKTAKMQKDYPFRPVPFTEVQITDKFWAPRIETNRAVSIPYCFGKCEENGRMANFDIAGGLAEGEHRGEYPFDDTDVYKILEGASYALMVQPDPKLDQYLDDLIAKMEAAQEEDGYLYTPRTNKSPYLYNWYRDERWINEARSHELYNAGHLFEAAVAHYLATNKRSLLDIALRFADLIDQDFGPGKNETPPGHQITEMGLVKLYRVTGDEKYLNLAKFFLDVRGKADERNAGVDRYGVGLWGEYNQDHKPVLEQDEAVGHAVRAVYMYAGMADVAALTGDQSYIKAMDTLWNNVTFKKYYITGGIGATGAGEAFGGNYDLPNMSAYCETCAQIGHVYWNHRMFLLDGDSKYIDVLERTLYNSVISGVSMEGTTFFYPNPLASLGQHERSPWFGCACCPGNVTRFIASVPGYIYAHRDDKLYVNLFVGGEGLVDMDRGSVKITQETNYPWDGNIKITLNPENSGEFDVLVRIPCWTQNQPVPSDLYKYTDVSNAKYTLKVNGEEISAPVEKGYAVISRNWQAGDSIEVDFPMPIRRVIAHEKVEDDRGRVAIERGPMVFCAEWPDNKDGHVWNIMLPDESELKAEWNGDLLNGVMTISGKAYGLSRETLESPLEREEQEIKLIPYYAWAHRGKGEMLVWIAREESAVRPLLPATIASNGFVWTSNERDASTVADPFPPRNSHDSDANYFHWWPAKGTKEWIQYDFKDPVTVSSVEVYWFDDTGLGECRPPASWILRFKEGTEWVEVANPSEYGVELDKYNKTTFDTVTTLGLRIEMQLPEGFSAGILRWKVE